MKPTQESEETQEPPVIDYVDVELPGKICRAVLGGGGRFLVLKLFERGELVVFDTAQRKIVGTVPATHDALVTAGRDLIVAVQPDGGQVTRWSLPSLEQDEPGVIAVDGTLWTIGMGYDANNPLLVGFAKERDQGAFRVVDTSTWEPRELMTGGTDPTPLPFRVWGKEGTELRPSADGSVFAMRNLKNAVRVDRLCLGTPPMLSSWHTNSLAYAIPTADGRGICTSKGYYSASFKHVSDTALVYSTTDAWSAIALDQERLDIKNAVTGAVLLSRGPLPELDQKFFKDTAYGTVAAETGLMYGERLYCIAEENLLVSIPASLDRLRMRDLSLGPLTQESPSLPFLEKLEDREVLYLPPKIGGAVLGGGGHYLILHFPELAQAKLFDLQTRTLVGEVPVPQNALLAASRDKLVAVNPVTGEVTVYSLPALRMQQQGKLESDGILNAIVMGHASEGPLLVHWTGDEPYFGLVNLVDLSVRQITRRTSDSNRERIRVSNVGNRFLGAEAAADGSTFVLWGGGIELLKIAPEVQVERAKVMGISPDPEGTAFGSIRGYQTIEGEFRAEGHCLPTNDSRCCVRLSQSAIELLWTANGEVISTLPAPDEYSKLREPRYLGLHQLMTHQRVFFDAGSGTLVTIPDTDDRLILRDVAIDFAKAPSVPERPVPEVAANESPTTPPTKPTKPAADDRAMDMAANGGAAEAPPTATPRPERAKRPLREWSDKTGQFSLRARMTSFGGGRVTLEKESGDTVKVPLSVLSNVDVEYVKEELEKAKR
jgi:hypothetical protein